MRLLYFETTKKASGFPNAASTSHFELTGADKELRVFCLYQLARRCLRLSVIAETNAEFVRG